jgi:muconolactone delta-isomerase
MRNNEEVLKNIIKTFNRANLGSKFKFNNDNLFYVDRVLSLYNGDEYGMVRRMKDLMDEGTKPFTLVPFFANMHTIVSREMAEAEEAKVKAKEEEEKQELKVKADVSTQVGDLASICAKIAEGSLLALAKEGQMSDIISAQVKAFVEENYGPIEKKVTFTFDGDRKYTPEGLTHKVFEKVLRYIQMQIPVYLYGPAGCGKGYIARQVAKALELQYGVSSGVTDEFQLFGFTDANGNYIETPFYKCYTQGGLFFLDEMDSSDATALEKLNGAIADKVCAFPAPIGVQPMHENFRLIGAGNTLGDGADSNYTARDVLDIATLDRFAKLSIDYDSRLEESLCSDRDALRFLRALRDGIRKCSITRAIISYRCMERISMCLNCFPDDFSKKELLKENVITNLTKDDLNTLSSYVQGHGDWTRAYEELRQEV